MKKGVTSSLVLAIGITQLIGISGFVFTSDNINGWYDTLLKPTFTPPTWLFSPVWTIIYFILGLVLWRIWTMKASKDRHDILALFYGQLVLNGFWSPIFFGLKSIRLAMLDIIVLWFFVAVLIIKIKDHDKTSAWLLLIYILWLSYASVLNFSIWLLN